MNPSSINKTRRITGNILITLGTLLLFVSAAGKFSGVAKFVESLNAFGYTGKVTTLAVLESCCAILYLIPFTRSLGLLLVSSYLGGAIATDWSHGHTPLPPAVILAVLWSGALLRHPEMAWSFRRTKAVLNSI